MKPTKDQLKERAIAHLRLKGGMSIARLETCLGVRPGFGGNARNPFYNPKEFAEVLREWEQEGAIELRRETLVEGVSVWLPGQRPANATFRVSSTFQQHIRVWRDERAIAPGVRFAKNRNYNVFEQRAKRFAGAN